MTALQQLTVIDATTRRNAFWTDYGHTHEDGLSCLSDAIAHWHGDQAVRRQFMPFLTPVDGNRAEIMPSVGLLRQPHRSFYVSTR